MKSRTLFVAGAIAVVTAIANMSACADSISAGAADPPPPQGPSFVDRDADATAAPDVAPDVAMCNSYVCPAPYATCLDAPGLCNTNLAIDINHCGSCDNTCVFADAGGSSSDNAVLFCAGGQCRIACAADYGDCNGKLADGCEAYLDNDPKNCGACGNACKAGDACWHGACGCPPGFTQCGDQCTHLEIDSENCAACGHVCMPPNDDAGAGVWPCGPGVLPPNYGPTCESSSCTLDCINGFGNCNGDKCSDGCETDLQNDPKNCGTCGHACAPEQGCQFGKCACDDPALTFCFACANLQTDIGNCGACGNVCPGPNDLNGNPVCVLGRCGYECALGHADCNARMEDGCEINTMVDPKNCGACGAQCDLDGGQPCAAGRCLTQPCDAGVVH